MACHLDRCQAIIWTSAGIVLIGPLGTNFSEILIGSQIFSFKEMHLKMSSTKWWPFCLGLNVLTHWGRVTHICVGNLAIIVSDNGLSPGRRQAIIWTNAGILLIGPLGTNLWNFNQNSCYHSRKCLWKYHLENDSHLSRPQCVNISVDQSTMEQVDGIN